MKFLIAVGAAALALALIIGGAIASRRVPCDWYVLHAAKDVPARCLNYYNGK